MCLSGVPIFSKPEQNWEILNNDASLSAPVSELSALYHHSTESSIETRFLAPGLPHCSMSVHEPLKFCFLAETAPSWTTSGCLFY